MATDARLHRPLPRPRLRGAVHLGAFVVSLPAGVVLVLTAPGGWAQGAAAVYAFGLSFMFGASALLHRRRWYPRTHRVLDRLDHSGILLCIAGTYTPVVGIGTNGWVRIAILTVVWGGALLIIGYDWLPVRQMMGIITGSFLAIGWVGVLTLPLLWRNLGVACVAGILGGGVVYTVGAVLLVNRRPDPWPDTFGYHEVWHLFVTMAAAIHFVTIATVVLPQAG
jgi:hemolysin III